LFSSPALDNGGWAIEPIVTRGTLFDNRNSTFTPTEDDWNSSSFGLPVNRLTVSHSVSFVRLLVCSRAFRVRHPDIILPSVHTRITTSTSHQHYINVISTSHQHHINITSTPHRHHLNIASTSLQHHIDITSTSHQHQTDFTSTSHQHHINIT